MDQFCAASTHQCTNWRGSGRCRGHVDCATGQSCTYATLTCTNDPQASACFSEQCVPACSGSYNCLNGDCINRDQNADCIDDGDCGNDLTCNVFDLRCAYRTSCPSSGCPTGLLCDLYYPICNSVPTADCLNAEGRGMCMRDQDCYGLRCVMGRCSARSPCTHSSDCVSPYYVCVANKCEPYPMAPCASDADCEPNGSLHCELEVGRCGRN
jgi:hypothetical protein